MSRPIIVIVAIVIAFAGWFFASPLIFDSEVDESFDLVLANGRVNLDAVMAMPETERNNRMQDIMAVAARAPDNSMSEATPDGAPKLLARGNFADADAIHKGTGQASLYALANGTHVVRFENFRTTNGPALVVYLAKHASPTTAADVSGAGFVSLGKLKGNVGNQNYAVPDNVDVSTYNSVVIWCELFDVLFSPAALRSVPPNSPRSE